MGRWFRGWCENCWGDCPHRKINAFELEERVRSVYAKFELGRPRRPQTQILLLRSASLYSSSPAIDFTMQAILRRRNTLFEILTSQYLRESESGKEKSQTFCLT